MLFQNLIRYDLTFIYDLIYILQIHAGYFTNTYMRHHFSLEISNSRFPICHLTVSLKSNVCDVFPQALGMNDGCGAVTSVDDTVRLINNH